MDKVRYTIEKKQLDLAEKRTGTGKTYSAVMLPNSPRHPYESEGKIFFLNSGLYVWVRAPSKSPDINAAA